MLYELHGLNSGKLPFIFHPDSAQKGTKKNANWHENLEILFITDGEGRISCDFETSQVATADMFIVNCNCLHSSESESKLDYLCLIIDTSFCLANGVDPREITFNKKIHDCEAARLFNNVSSAFENTSELREIKIKSAVLSLLLFLCENHIYSPKYPKQRPKLFSPARHAIEYIKSNLSNKLTLDNISAQVGYSRSYFSREFKALTGYTVVEYINNERCAYARKLLSLGTPVSECAAEAGFESTSYFTRTYKRIMGRSPAHDKGRPIVRE